MIGRPARVDDLHHVLVVVEALGTLRHHDVESDLAALAFALRVRLQWLTVGYRASIRLEAPVESRKPRFFKTLNGAWLPGLVRQELMSPPKRIGLLPARLLQPVVDGPGLRSAQRV